MNSLSSQVLALLKQWRERPGQDSNPELCDGGAVLCRLSYQTNWVIMWANDKTVDDEYRSRYILYMMLLHEVY